MYEPSITVVTPSLNQGRFLEETINSVLQQDYPSVEYLVIDGGSSDDSIDIIRRYADHLAYWVSEPDTGQSHAINKGFARARGDILCWINADDLLLPGALRRVAQILGRRDIPAWLSGSTQLIDENSQVIGKRSSGPLSLETFYGWTCHWFPQQSTFWNRAMWEQVGGVRQDLHYVMDMELWFRMWKVCEPIVVADILSAYRMHDEAKCIGQSESAKSEQMNVFRELLSGSLESGSDKSDSVSLRREDLNQIIESYVAVHERLAVSEAALQRLREHVFIRKCIRFWRVFVNRSFRP